MPGEGIRARVITTGDSDYLVIPNIGGATIRTSQDVIIAITKKQREALGVPEVVGESVRGILTLVPEEVHDEMGVLAGVEQPGTANRRL